MPTKTKIEWTDYSSNPIRFKADNGVVVPWACVKVSPGCANCYAEGQSWRFLHRDYTVENMRDLTPFIDEAELRALLTSKAISGKRVFIADMTDIFGDWVTEDMLDRLFAVFALRPDVTFQVLTKRAKRMREYFGATRRDRVSTAAAQLCGDPAPEMVVRFWPLLNVWLGVSCEDQQRADERIPLLLQTPAAVRFVSAEPLLGPISFTSECDIPATGDHPDLIGYMVGKDDGKSTLHKERYEALAKSGLSWVIVGGESGPGARPCDVAWVRSLVRQCQAADVPVFVKQMGSVPLVVAHRQAHWDYRFIKQTEDKRFEAFGVDRRHWRMRLADRKGGDPSEWAEDLRVREFPQPVSR